MEKSTVFFEVTNNRINPELPSNFAIGITAPATLMWHGINCALYNHGVLPYLLALLGITTVDVDDVKHTTREDVEKKYPDGFLEVTYTSILKVFLNTFLRVSGVEDEMVQLGALPRLLPDVEMECEMDCEHCSVFNGATNASKYLADEAGNVVICDFNLSVDDACNDDGKMRLRKHLNNVAVLFKRTLDEGDIKLNEDGSLAAENASYGCIISHSDDNNNLFEFSCEFDENADVHSIHIILVNPDYEGKYQKYSDFIRDAINMLSEDHSFQRSIAPQVFDTFGITDECDDTDCDCCDCCDCGYCDCDDEDNIDIDFEENDVPLWDCCMSVEYNNDGTIEHCGVLLRPDDSCTDTEKLQTLMNEVALYLAKSLELTHIIKDGTLYDCSGNGSDIIASHCYESENIDLKLTFGGNSNISKVEFEYFNEEKDGEERAACNKVVEIMLKSGLFKVDTESREYILNSTLTESEF